MKEMTFDELLKSIEGLTDEQASAIKGGMKDNKIYLSVEENIDERYTKLRSQHDEASKQLGAANDLIKTLQEAAKGNEDLQANIANYQKQAEEAEKRAAKAERDSAIKVELLAKGAVPEDIDYLMWRIDNGDTEVKVGDDGKLSGMDEAVKALKTSHPNQFKDGGKKKFEGAQLPDNPGGSNTGTVTQEQFNKMGYSDRMKLYSENRETYNALAGKN